MMTPQTTMAKHKIDVWHYVGMITLVGMVVTIIGTLYVIAKNIIQPPLPTDKSCKIKINQFSLQGTTNEDGECAVFDFKLF